MWRAVTCTSPSWACAIGAVPPGHTTSITQQEYQAARDHQIPTLVFVKDEDEIKPRFHDAVTQENPRERIQNFRLALTTAADDGTRGMPFKTATDLKEQVLKAYLRFQQRRVPPHAPGPAAPPVARIEGRPAPACAPAAPTKPTASSAATPKCRPCCSACWRVNRISWR